MNADSFHVCYGLRFEVDASNESEMMPLEEGRDPRQLQARQHGLDSWWVVTPREGTYFLFIGKRVGRFGWEGTSSGSLSDEELAVLVAATKLKLQAAGFAAEPAWHFQVEPGY
jgi:hypothetical protein